MLSGSSPMLFGCFQILPWSFQTLLGEFQRFWGCSTHAGDFHGCAVEFPNCFWKFQNFTREVHGGSLSFPAAVLEFPTSFLKFPACLWELPVGFRDFPAGVFLFPGCWLIFLRRSFLFPTISMTFHKNIFNRRYGRSEYLNAGEHKKQSTTTITK
jgi:hypothetical protein